MNSVSLSPLGLFFQAGLVGKSVMAILLIASVWCWFLILEAWISGRRLRAAARASANGAQSPLLAPIFLAGEKAALRPASAESYADRRWRIGETMTRAARALLLRAEGGLPSLAVISSTAPFVGLFGTVWGIMSAFSGIAEAHDTSLAVVAPGIAEALAATAYGLAAAIPASIAYNRLSGLFSRLSAELDALVQEAADDFAAVPAPRSAREAA